MNEQDKLRVLLPHWIEHNEEHAAEFRRWSGQAGAARTDIVLAAELMGRVNVALKSALELLGGPLAAGEIEKHHDHDDEGQP